MKRFHDPRHILKREQTKWEDYVQDKELIEAKDDELFHIGQCYEDAPASTLVCKHCGGNQFNVGQGSYFTAIRCVTCEYETCVHDG